MNFLVQLGVGSSEWNLMICSKRVSCKQQMWLLNFRHHKVAVNRPPEHMLACFLYHATQYKLTKPMTPSDLPETLPTSSNIYNTTTTTNTGSAAVRILVIIEVSRLNFSPPAWPHTNSETKLFNTNRICTAFAHSTSSQIIFYSPQISINKTTKR